MTLGDGAFRASVRPLAARWMPDTPGQLPWLLHARFALPIISGFLVLVAPLRAPQSASRVLSLCPVTSGLLGHLGTMNLNSITWPLGRDSSDVTTHAREHVYMPPQCTAAHEDATCETLSRFDQDQCQTYDFWILPSSRMRLRVILSRTALDYPAASFF